MADESGRPNPHRLYRDREHAMLAGVCSGIANYFGFNRFGTRLVMLVLSLMFLPFAIISYIVLAIVLPVKPVNPELNPEQEKFWRNVTNAPADVFGSVRHRFRDLDLRLQRMEAFVTSPAFTIDRELGAARREQEPWNPGSR